MFNGTAVQINFNLLNYRDSAFSYLFWRLFWRLTAAQGLNTTNEGLKYV
jgi:hypothetical protein